MFDGNKILKSEENVQYDFCNTIVEKDEKNIKIKGKKTQLFSNFQKQLREKKIEIGKCAWRWELFLSINCTVISHNIRKL